MDDGKGAAGAAAAAADRGAVLRCARAGVEGGKRELLSKAAALGWNPSMPGDWFALGMAEGTGVSIQWLMERFPLDAALSPVMNAAFSDASGGCRWSARAMLAAEDCAFEQGAALRWIGACSRSREAADYFETTLASNPFWSRAMQGELGGIEPADVLRALCVNVLEKDSDPRARAACVDFCAGQIDARAGGGLMAANPKMLVAVARLAFDLLSAGRPLEAIEPLLVRLPRWMVSMGHMPLLYGKGTNVAWAAGNFTSPGTAKCSAKESDPCWEIGAFALMVGQESDVDLALRQGWIGPVEVAMQQKCEDPDFIAYDCARTVERLGREVDTAERWLKCEETIRAARMPEEERERLLRSVERRDPSAWSEGGKKIHQIERYKSSSPLALLLACSGQSVPKRGAELSATVGKLSAAGFRLKDAVGSHDPLGAAALAKIQGLAWAERVIEREEIEECSLAGGTRGRRLSL